MFKLVDSGNTLTSTTGPGNTELREDYCIYASTLMVLWVLLTV